jgi:hypothetical protein
VVAPAAMNILSFLKSLGITASGKLYEISVEVGAEGLAYEMMWQESGPQASTFGTVWNPTT